MSTNNQIFSGLPIKTGESSVFQNNSAPDFSQFSHFTKDLIISASGWRTIFAVSGNEEDSTEIISPEAELLSGVMVDSFISYLEHKLQKSSSSLTIVLAMDSRPTGPSLAHGMMCICAARGLKIRYLFIASAPEVMAYVRQTLDLDGFVYISASHNPIGHNGVKFGLNSGGVIGGKDAQDLMKEFRSLLENPATPSTIHALGSKADPEVIESWYEECFQNKKSSLQAYNRFSREVCSDSQDEKIIDQRMEDLQLKISQKNIGIIGELNGSARGVSIDRDFFTSLGARITLLNDIPRQIVHRIVPEGSSLDDCKKALESAYKSDPRYTLGYVPDCDGDRGNVVWYDTKKKAAREIEAQQIFALVVLSELAWLVYSKQVEYNSNGEPNNKIAVVVNGPTSMRIESVAKVFHARVFRAEVGEANVVNLAQELREQGWIVRILGEGSNGGNITYPSSVRDPLNTICSVLKLLAIPDLYKIYAQRAGFSLPDDYDLTYILESLPQFTTTSAYENRAIMKVKTTDHRKLKSTYEKIFLEEWPKNIANLSKLLQVTNWEEVNYEGTKSNIGMGAQFRSGDERGGLKIILKDQFDSPRAFLWMRGSGTEPVFRVLVDVEGNNPEAEEFLLIWHTQMIVRADNFFLSKYI